MSRPLLPPPCVNYVPAPPSGMFNVGYAVTTDGLLILLRSDFDVWGDEARRRVEKAKTARSLPDGAKGRLSLFNGEVESDVIEFPLEHHFPVMDRLPDGHWVVADPRCEFGEMNARLLSPTGDLIRRFCLGDGIEHLQCDASGAIWVGYFDEGVIGAYGWSDPEPIGAPGLVKFDSEGRILWRFDGKACGDAWIGDCYALNVCGDRAFTHYYDSFPVVEVRANGSARHWDCQITGAKALAIAGQTAMLAGGYKEDAERIVLLDLADQSARPWAEFKLGVYRLTADTPSLFQARADTLHVVRGRYWWRAPVESVQALAAVLDAELKPHDKLVRYWEVVGFGTTTESVDDDRLDALEARYGIRLPADFRDYLRYACPIDEAGTDANITTWWNLDRIKNVPDELQHPINNPEIAAIAPQCLFFADFAIWAMAWAIDCGQGESRGRVIVFSGSEYFVADSFTAFVEAYVRDYGSLL